MFDLRFQFDDNGDNTITLNGRTCHLETRGSVRRLVGLTPGECSDSFGGIVISEVYTKLGDILQAARDTGFPEVWGRLDDDVLDDVYDKVSY